MSAECIWTDDGEWSGSCGYSFNFVPECSDGPEDCEWKFCPSCGKLLQQKPEAE